ncbi:MAG TPA: hypothetical protein EYH01_01555 [Campylobacterales bacterium]|nr:hypothetical protein [Campylobacterales bacterium]
MIRNFLNIALFIFALAFLFSIFQDEKEIESVDVSVLPKEQKEIVSQKSLDIEYAKEEVNSQVSQPSEKKEKVAVKKEEDKKSKIIKEMIENEELIPLKKSWDRVGDTEYKVYVEKNEFQDSELPPMMPKVTNIKINNKDIMLQLPATTTKSYIALKKGDSIEYKDLETISTPPSP